MAELKVTCVEGVESFQAEGNEAVVTQLLAEWRARNDVLREQAMATYERLGGSGPGVPPRGSQSPTVPFGPRRTS